MPRTKTSTIKSDFVEVIVSSSKLYDKVIKFTDQNYNPSNSEALHPSQARQVISLAYLNMVSSWEIFLHELFLRYMTGAKSESGFQPKLRVGPCITLQHATDVLFGKNNVNNTKFYISWANYKDVEERAKVYFHSGHPFTKLPENYRQRISDSNILRNRIAHKSEKCIDQFKKVARRFNKLQNNAKLQRGYSVGHLLIEKNITGFSHEITKDADDYFSSYCFLYLALAEILAP